MSETTSEIEIALGAAVVSIALAVFAVLQLGNSAQTLALAFATTMLGWSLSKIMPRLSSLSRRTIHAVFPLLLAGLALASAIMTYLQTATRISEWIELAIVAAVLVVGYLAAFPNRPISIVVRVLCLGPPIVIFLLSEYLFLHTGRGLTERAVCWLLPNTVVCSQTHRLPSLQELNVATSPPPSPQASPRRHTPPPQRPARHAESTKPAPSDTPSLEPLRPAPSEATPAPKPAADTRSCQLPSGAFVQTTEDECDRQGGSIN